MTLPPRCSNGNTELLLDDGLPPLTAHSQYLRHASTVFRDALSCSKQAEPGQSRANGETEAPAAKRRRVLLQLPLPGCSREQVLLLLGCLYAWTRETFMHGLGPFQLVELATLVADKLGCRAVLELVDSTLVKTCKQGYDSSDLLRGWLTAKEAFAQFLMARRLHLAEFEKHVGIYIGEHSREVKVGLPDAGITAILQGGEQVQGSLQCEINNLQNRLQYLQKRYGEHDDDPEFW